MEFGNCDLNVIHDLLKKEQENWNLYISIAVLILMYKIHDVKFCEEMRQKENIY